MRSGSHLGQIPDGSDQVLVIDGGQNVIQGISRNPHFHEDLACATAPSFEVARTVELQCNKTDVIRIHGECRCRAQLEKVSPPRRNPPGVGSLPRRKEPSSRYSLLLAT